MAESSGRLCITLVYEKSVWPSVYRLGAVAKAGAWQALDKALSLGSRAHNSICLMPLDLLELES